MEYGSYQPQELIPIVSELAEQYLGYEHTSMTYEKAQELMEAVLYCIRENENSGKNTLASERLHPKDAYESGRQTVIWKFHRLQEIYGKLAVDFQDYGLECLKDTILLGIPEFIARYDIRYAPQETILTLDYPVLKDIRTLSGADAILEYVICIDYEQKFLKKFDASYVLEMLSAYQEGYEDMVENICGIVLQNMMGHLMLNKPLGAAGISREESERLSYFLEGKTKNEIRGFLETMLKNITESYLGGSRELYEYFSCAVSDLTARFSHNAKLHCLDKIVFF